MKTNPVPLHTRIYRFANTTKEFIKIGDIRRAKFCIRTMEKLFLKSSADLRNVITNNYLFSITSFMEIQHCNVRNLLPETFLVEYKKQINAGGI